ncbi:MAG TPA: N-formylglutamate amidohydrolase [Polyangiaceae bacterium]|jgi:predicted N-formylglutamate amidohydrolase|nr:N-formylglutamate amidohydrolase [Polyangiaceae bacterium]
MPGVAESETVHAASLLAADEPSPVEVIEDNAGSPFLITCDHAGRRLPRALGNLGLSDAELNRHIAWDLGAAGVARELARTLGAFAALQVYSRLVIDCNRPPDVPSSIVQLSEHTEVPGNRALSPEQTEQRLRAIFMPYHERIVQELERRTRAGQATLLIAVHSFTPTFKGVARPWHVGVLYNRDARLAHALLQLLRQEPELVVGDNEPYSVSDLSDYGVVEYGERRGNAHVEIELRQDLLADESGQVNWARRLAGLLKQASEPLLESK